MENHQNKIIKTINAAIPPYSVPGILMRAVYFRSRENLKLLKVRHLMDADTLGGRIEYINNMAHSESAERRFNILKLHTMNAGLFSIVLNAMSPMIYVLSGGLIPVIDMRYSGIYLEEDESGKVNAWEKYFKQPCGYGLEDINGSNTFPVDYGPMKRAIFQQDDSFDLHLKLWSVLFKNFVKLNDECSEYVEKEYNRLIKPGMRVLGVFCRGTDYVRMRPQGCPVQPETEDVIKKVKEVMPQWGCEYIYITTEERKIAERFEDAFPGKVLTVTQQYYDNTDIDYSQTHVGRVSFNRENDKFLKGLEYLTSVMVLSRCASAVMSAASGSTAAMYINGGKYENLYVFNLGTYK